MEVAVRDLTVWADIGIRPEEIGKRQTLIVDVVLSLDKIATDEIDATFDYREIVRAAQALGARRIALIETFATTLAQTMLSDPRVIKASVTVSKPAALPSGLASTRVSLQRAPT